MKTEHDLQVFVLEWAQGMAYQYPELSLLYAVPNGAKLPWKKDQRGQRYSPEAMRLKAEGMKSGVPDLCLPVPRQGFHSLYIELKQGRNKPSDAQLWWLEQLARQGHLAVVCWSADEAITVLRDYLGI